MFSTLEVAITSSNNSKYYRVFSPAVLKDKSE